MKISYFSIYDKKAMLFSQLFPSPTLGSAERSFQESINNPETSHHKYPSDYALYHCFDFDDSVASMIVSHDPPFFVVEGSQLVV